MNNKKNLNRNKIIIIIDIPLIMSRFNMILKTILIILFVKMMKEFKNHYKVNRSLEDIFFFNKTIVESHRGMNREFT